MMQQTMLQTRYATINRRIYSGDNTGLLNMILVDFLGGKSYIQWLANPRYALWSVIVATIWLVCDSALADINCSWGTSTGRSAPFAGLNSVPTADRAKASA